MGRLHYNNTTSSFVGERLWVSTTAFFAAVGEMADSGIAGPEAYGRLLDEAEWSPAMAGVRVVLRLRAMLEEAGHILRDDPRFAQPTGRAGSFPQPES
jgi:hypothetical protein